jgi:F-type H+-transporting ATPase subunit gamma
MATERELNNRIRSVRNISQVTSALAAVSAAKASKAQRQVQASRDYASKAYAILVNLASQPGAGETSHPLLTSRTRSEKCGHPDHRRPRAGRRVQCQHRRVYRALHPCSAARSADYRRGRKGRDLMVRRGYNVIASFDSIPDEPKIYNIAPIADIAIDDYLSGKVDDVFVAYTDFVSLVQRDPTVTQLLP